MTLILREADVRRLLTMPDAIAALDVAFKDYATGVTQNISRQRIVLRPQKGVLHVLPAAVPALDVLGFKAYTTYPGGVRFVVNLYRASTGELLAMLEADWLGRMRTGAASGLATRYMARPSARVVALLGAGGQAETQALAMVAARDITVIRVWSRNQERAREFCVRLSAQITARLEPTPTAEAAVRGADIIVTATTARDPALHGDWLAPGAHINAMGSNWADRREIDTATVARADSIAADSVAQAQIEAGDLIIPAQAGKLDWARVHELHAIVAGHIPGRPAPDSITLFKSLGLGLEDVAVAARVHALARQQGIGEEIALFTDITASE
jgi:ornithine cyclodeaminase/alanine dehydrogenase-like protein (mu-crystallin family)